MKLTEKQLRQQHNRWNLLAQRHALKTTKLDFNERELWWAHVGQNLGWEQNGSGQHFLRPVLIVKKFHRSFLWAVPLTTTKRTGRHYVTLQAKKCRGQLILSQIKPLDAVRLVQKIERIDTPQYEKICTLIRRLL